VPHPSLIFFVMAGLVPAIHVLLRPTSFKDVDARDKPGHDEVEVFGPARNPPGMSGGLPLHRHFGAQAVEIAVD
jgi:hypothetical protein